MTPGELYPSPAKEPNKNTYVGPAVFLYANVPRNISLANQLVELIVHFAADHALERPKQEGQVYFHANL